jgi:hypothetical protein
VSSLSFTRKSLFIRRTTLPYALILGLALSISGPGFLSPGADKEERFPVECPYCHERKQSLAGPVNCSCGDKFVVVLCTCDTRHAAVGIQEKGWYCPVRDKWLWARLCPQCGRLATTVKGLYYQCDRGHSFRMGRCEKCGWLAGEHPDRYLLCEFCGHHTALGRN